MISLMETGNPEALRLPSLALWLNKPRIAAITAIPAKKHPITMIELRFMPYPQPSDPAQSAPAFLCIAILQFRIMQMPAMPWEFP